MNQFKMLRAMIYVFIGLGWLTFIFGIVLAAASFINNTWIMQLHMPLVLHSPIVTGFVVLLVTFILTIMWLASAEMLVLMIDSYEDVKKIRTFFSKK